METFGSLTLVAVMFAFASLLGLFATMAHAGLLPVLSVVERAV
jgi:hypothetical protein